MSASTERDWAAETADKIEHAIGAVRTKTTDPLVGISRWIVYGLLAAIVASMAVPLMVIALVRALDAYLPSGVWLPYLILGGIFTLAGALLWSRRSAGSSET